MVKVHVYFELLVLKHLHITIGLMICMEHVCRSNIFENICYLDYVVPPNVKVFQSGFCSFTLYPAYSRVSRGILVFRHSVSDAPPNFQDITC